MGAEVVDTIAVVNLAILDDILRAQPIFNDKQRLLVTVVEFEQGNF